jgi:hypothetical protein
MQKTCKLTWCQRTDSQHKHKHNYAKRCFSACQNSQVKLHDAQVNQSGCLQVLKINFPGLSMTIIETNSMTFNDVNEH